MTAEQVPPDLMKIRDAQDLVNRSRNWIEARVNVYRIGRTDYVSRSAVIQANQDYETPRLREKDD